MSSSESDFFPLTDQDRDLFDSYKDAIHSRIAEVLPNRSSTFSMKPISLRQQIGCGTFYTFKVLLDDHETVDVAFHLGGKRRTPLVGPPHFEITKSE